MAKCYTFPTLFDAVLQISISDLKRMKYLAPNTIKWGKIQWRQNGSKIAEISIYINTCEGFIELDYNHNQMPVKYEIRLISLPSNIGKGNVWYFECPHTKKRCRKLLLNRKEINKIENLSKNTGFTVVPTKLFINEKGLAKVVIAVAKGKKAYDKRQSLKEKDDKREMDRMFKK